MHACRSTDTGASPQAPQRGLAKGRGNMDPFKRRQLGGTDVMLPQIGFGAAPLGELFTKVSDADAEATLKSAWDAGVRYYDTAPWYGRGQSEHRVGRFLYKQDRNELIL